MAGGISINILSNVREAVRGVDDVADAVEEVGDRLNDLSKEGDTATDRMEKDFRDLTRAADKTSDALRDKFRSAYRDVKRSSEDASDDMIRNQRRIGERSEEVGQEIRQNLGEGIANAARGDFASLSDSIGDTLGGAVAGIGGIGFAAAGAAGALGVGALVSAFMLAEEHRKKLEERADDLATAYIDAGTNMLDAMTIASRAAEIMTDPELRKEAKSLSETLGIDLRDAARALAGDMNTLALANKIVGETEAERFALLQESTEYLSGDFSAADKKRLDQLLAQKQAVADLNGVNDTANETFKEQQKLLKDLIREAGNATEEVDELGNAVYTLPDGTQILIDAETKQATTDISKFKGDVDGIPRVHTTTVRLVPDTAAWDAKLRQIQQMSLIKDVIIRPGQVVWY